MKFRNLPQVFFSKAHVNILRTNDPNSVLENRPPLKKMHYASLSKTLVLEILQRMVFQSKE
jgi:hypothetical protein